MGSGIRHQAAKGLLLLLLFLFLAAAVASSSSQPQLDLQQEARRVPALLGASGTLRRLSDSSSVAARGRMGEGHVVACDQTLWDMVVTQAKITKSRIDSFKESYAQAKFSLSWELVDSFFDPGHDLEYLKVCDEAHQCSEVLPRLPPPAGGPEEGLRELPGLAGRYAVALEQLFLDQSLGEDAFQGDVDASHRLMESLALVAEEGLEACGAEPSGGSALGSLAGKAYVEAGPALRDQRGFAALRQCLLGLDYVLGVFSGRS